MRRFLLWLDQRQCDSTTDTMGKAGKESMRTETERLSKRDDIRLQDNGHQMGLQMGKKKEQRVVKRN